MKYLAVLSVGEDGWIVAHIPALPGCASQGRSRERALAAVIEAAEGWLEAQAAKLDPVPADDLDAAVEEMPRMPPRFEPPEREKQATLRGRLKTR